MKTCLKCGKDNFSNLTYCIECNELLPETIEQQNEPFENNIKKNEGIHWIWAFLIMVICRWLITQFAVSFFFGGNQKYNITAAMVVDYIINYAALYLWLTLTGRRYARAGAWVFFSYLWYILSPLSIAASYASLSLTYYIGDPETILVIAVLCSVCGAFYLSNYRKAFKQ